MTASLSTLYERYSSRFNSNGAVLERKPVFRNEETWVVAHDQLHPLLKALRDESGFDFLIDISSVDNMEDSVKLAETEGVVCAKQTSGAELGCEASVYLHGSGRVAFLFFILYGLIRIVLEYFREPDQQIGFPSRIFGIELTMGQILSAGLIVVGVLAWAIKHHLDTRPHA